MTRLSFLLTLFTLVLTVAFFAMGCSKPKAPTLTPESTRITSVTPNGMGVRVTLNAHNPNGFDLNTQSVTCTITLGNKVTLGPITEPHGVSLPANKTTQVTFELEATWEQAAQLAKLAASGPTVPYEVEGKMAIGGKNLNVSLPFKISGEVSQTQLIAAGLKGLPAIPGLPILK